MTSHVDSAPYLIQRAGEISLSSRISDALKAKGVTTLAQLAFCVGQPGQVLNPTDFETWSDALLTGMTVGEKASLRRLILEAQTMLVASLKDMAEPSEGAAPKKVGVAEAECSDGSAAHSAFGSVLDRSVGAQPRSFGHGCAAMGESMPEVYRT